MTTVPPEATLAYLVGLLEAHNPELVALLTANTEEAFCSAVEQALDRAVRTIEGGGKLYGKLKPDERVLSHLLTSLMAHSGFNATAETYNNGHVDVVVEHLLRGRWRYLGECKI